MRRMLCFPVLLVALALAQVPAEEDLHPWRLAADERIRELRQGDFTLELRNAQGQALGEVALEARQVQHHFRFGTAIAGSLESQRPREQRYRQFILDHFNTVVSENAMKWYSIEAEAGKIDFSTADRQLAFAQEHGLAMRGHALFWAKKRWNQDWLQELDEDALRQAVEQHLQRTVARYRGQLIAWDVNNEMLTGHFYRDRLGPEIRPWMFQQAHQLDPDTPLFVNEYAILGNQKKLQEYIALIEELQRQGAPIHGLGIQEHACERFAADATVAAAEASIPERTAPAGPLPLIPAEIWRDLDQLGELGLPIHLTEISAQTDDPQRRADALEMIFRVGFAHPAVESILLWGFWERRHWLGERAALMAADGSLTPAGERISALLREEWRSQHRGTSDATGRVSFRGFYGSYHISVQDAQGQTLQAQVDLHPENTAQVVTLQPLVDNE